MIQYGIEWPDGTEQIDVEMEMIRRGGYKIRLSDGVKCGEGLFHHYKALQQLLWGSAEEHHRWSDLCLQEILNNRITVVVGSRDTGKTHVCLSRFGLTDYFVFPDETLVMVSSTTLPDLKKRVWGDITDLFKRAKERHPWLPGNMVDSKTSIFTDTLDDKGDVRDARKGIVGIPCKKGDGEWAGMDAFVGIKQRRRMLLGDEVQFMTQGYLTTFSNLDKGAFKGVFCGNPLGRGDPLDQLSEPACGWSAQPEPTKTATWDNKRGGRTVNLVGTDSPNFDAPEDQPPPFPYLIDRGDVQRVVSRYGPNSLQYWSQIRGVRKAGLLANRVLTRDLCERFKAFRATIWASTDIVKIYALDAAYGGDRPVGGKIEYGLNVLGENVIRVYPPRVIQLDLACGLTPEEQLAMAVKTDCNSDNIPASHVFFDAGMRATLATQMARLFSPECNAVNFGGPATDRPVSADDWVIDSVTKQRRLKRCNEAYSKFVTELWWSVRMVVESEQMTELPESVMREFEMREWTKVAGDRYELETKVETKKRMGESPDEADWLSIGVEGARRLGFVIRRLPSAQTKADDQEWLERELQKYRHMVKTRSLRYH